MMGFGIFKLSCLGPLRLDTRHNPSNRGKPTVPRGQNGQLQSRKRQEREPQRREREKQA
jgi:hypothetical protein